MLNKKQQQQNNQDKTKQKKTEQDRFPKRLSIWKIPKPFCLSIANGS